MDRPGDSQNPLPEAQQEDKPIKVVPASYRSLYLIIYNAVSALLWSVVLGRTLAVLGLHGHRSVYTGAGAWTQWTQTLAIMEVAHAASGLVRAPLLTTLMQVASRYLLVWFIIFPFPGLATYSMAYSTMLIAWSTTEVIRYSYFAVNLAYGRVPDWLLWLRYNTFFVLYPMGITSECWLVYLAIGPARKVNAALEWVLKLVLFIYIPGSYILFTHMMAQRRKVMRGSDGKKTN